MLNSTSSIVTPQSGQRCSKDGNSRIDLKTVGPIVGREARPRAAAQALDAQIGEFSVPKYTCHARADLATRLNRMYTRSPKR